MVTAVSTEEFEDLRENPEVKVVDVLSTEHFSEGHIPGAINIPLENIASEALKEFDKSDDIVVYCKDLDCSASPKAAEKLESLGFRNVYDYEVGLKGWKESGHETE
ncbi:MAG: rhodanese-like domain-containing protein [Candidatus Nanohaloarchaea archaeon]